MGRKTWMVLLLGFALGCGSSQPAAEEPASQPTESATSEETPAQDPVPSDPVAFHFELIKDGEVLSTPKITSLPGSPMTISNEEIEFTLSFEHAEGGAKLYGDWTGGEIAATKGPFGTRVSLVVDPERGLELVVTARKHKPEAAAPPSE